MPVFKRGDKVRLRKIPENNYTELYVQMDGIRNSTGIVTSCEPSTKEQYNLRSPMSPIVHIDFGILAGPDNRYKNFFIWRVKKVDSFIQGNNQLEFITTGTQLELSF